MRVLKKGSIGSDVMKLQAVLKKIGYNLENIDGVFGSETEKAVIKFQSNNGLNADGIVGAGTYYILNGFILGYDSYIIRTGDTINSIATNYYTNVNRIITANPGLNINNLFVGRKIIVPYGIDIVDTNVNYTYEIMEKDIQGLKARYPLSFFELPDFS